MKLSKHIELGLAAGQTEFDPGILPDMEVDDRSLSRIKFEIQRKK